MNRNKLTGTCANLWRQDCVGRVDIASPKKIRSTRSHELESTTQSVASFGMVQGSHISPFNLSCVLHQHWPIRFLHLTGWTSLSKRVWNRYSRIPRNLTIQNTNHSPIRLKQTYANSVICQRSISTKDA